MLPPVIEQAADIDEFYSEVQELSDIISCLVLYLVLPPVIEQADDIDEFYSEVLPSKRSLKLITLLPTSNSQS